MANFIMFIWCVILFWKIFISRNPIRLPKFPWMNNDDYYNGNESSKTTLKITINSDDSSVDAKPLNKPVHSGRAVHNGKELKIDKK